MNEQRNEAAEMPLRDHASRATARRGWGRHARAVGALLAAVLLAAACDASTPPPASETPSINPNAGVVRIAAASSLETVLTAQKGAIEAANPGSRIAFSFGPSTSLAGQVATGGFDLFAADDLALAQTVVAGRHAAGPAQVFAVDPIVLVVPTANPGAITGPQDLARPGVRIAVGAADAPLAGFTTQVIAKLAAQSASPAAFTAAIAKNTTASPDDGAALVARVGAGQADAAFVYVSDVKDASKIAVIELPVPARVSARFAVVVIATAVDPAAAAGVARWLTTADGTRALAQYGFEAPGTP